jgi:predicted signal transduction protein with EAL and GGDEF domain
MTVAHYNAGNVTNITNVATMKGMANMTNVTTKKLAGYYFVIHNETFSKVGITQDIVAPLWSGVVAGAVLVTVCGLCVALFCSSYRQRTAIQPAYEGLPLITVKTMRR